MSEIKTKIRTYNDVIDLFGEEKAADMLSEALDWSTIDPKNDKKNILERKPLLLDPYMTYEGEDYCKHIVAGFLGDRDLDWASGYIDEEKIKNGQVMPADLKSALSMALDNELSTSWAYLDALSSQCAEIFNKFAGYIESAGLASGVLVPGEYELDSNALNADVSERFNIQYGFQCDQMIDAMQFDMTLILTEKVDSMDGYKLIQSVCDWREENLEVIEDAENNLDYGKVPSYVAYERPADIGTTIIDELCASQGTAVEKLVNYPTTKFERTMRDELFEALAVNETTISLMAKVPSSVFLDAVACKNSWMPSETQIRDIDTNRSPWQLNVSATTGRAPRMARFPTPSPALPHRNASTTITGVWRTLSLPKTLSCTPNRLRMVQRGFQKTAGTSTPEAARLPSRSRFSIGSRALRNSAHEPVPPPSSRA